MSNNYIIASLLLVGFVMFRLTRKKEKTAVTVADISLPGAPDLLLYKLLMLHKFPAELSLLIVAQAKHETGNFSSKGFRVRNSLFGYGFVKNNRFQLQKSGGKHPEDNGQYAAYSTLENSILDIIGYYKRRSTKFFPISSIPAYALALKEENYYTDTVANYTKGLTHFFSRKYS